MFVNYDRVQFKIEINAWEQGTKWFHDPHHPMVNSSNLEHNQNDSQGWELSTYVIPAHWISSTSH